MIQTTISLPFGQALRVWRQARGLTQEQLARRAKVSRPNLSAMERGRREVSLGTLRALAAGLDIRPGVLADGVAPVQAHGATHTLSREALERVAEAVVQGTKLHDPYEHFVADALRKVTRHRLAAAGGDLRGPRAGKRQTEAAWLALESTCPSPVLDSVLQRIADRQR